MSEITIQGIDWAEGDDESFVTMTRKDYNILQAKLDIAYKALNELQQTMEGCYEIPQCFYDEVVNALAKMGEIK